MPNYLYFDDSKHRSNFMTQVSRYPLTKQLEQQMFRLFHSALANLHTSSDIELYVNDILTPTEKIMLGKRLAIALLLERKYNHRAIQRILRVSSGTIANVHLTLKTRGAGYRKVIKRILQEESLDAVLDNIDRSLNRIAHLSNPTFHLPRRPRPVL
jgi:uncharacterized protein YerC